MVNWTESLMFKGFYKKLIDQGVNITKEEFNLGAQDSMDGKIFLDIGVKRVDDIFNKYYPIVFTHILSESEKLGIAMKSMDRFAISGVFSDDLMRMDIQKMVGKKLASRNWFYDEDSVNSLLSPKVVERYKQYSDVEKITVKAIVRTDIHLGRKNISEIDDVVMNYLDDIDSEKDTKQ